MVDPRLVVAVERYVGRRPEYRELRALDAEAWRREVGDDSRLLGGTAAMLTDDGDILVRRGFEGDALHELVHAAGVGKARGQSDFIMEGLAQAAAEAIGRRWRVPVRRTYAEEVSFVRDRLAPVTGYSVQELVRGYAAADDGIGFLADSVWARHARSFKLIDWGANPRAHFRAALFGLIGSHEEHLNYLIDELGVARSPRRRRAPRKVS